MVHMQVLFRSHRTVQHSRCSDWMIDKSCFDFWQGEDVIPYIKSSIMGLVSTQPPTQWVRWTLLSGADHSSPLVSRLRMSGCVIYSCLICLHGLRKDNVDCCLLGCCAVYRCRNISTFHWILLPASCSSTTVQLPFIYRDAGLKDRYHPTRVHGIISQNRNHHILLLLYSLLLLGIRNHHIHSF